MKSPKYEGESMKAGKSARGYAQGGAVKVGSKMTGGAGGALGRLEKAKAAKKGK